MNSNVGLSKRILSLFPVKAIKDHFVNAHGTTQGVLIADIASKYPPKDISKFALDNINISKQHIYIFELNKKFKVSDIDVGAFPVKIEFQSHTASEVHFLCLPKVKYSVITTLPTYLQSELHFLQPLLVRFTGKYLIFQATILEKNIEHYFVNMGKVFVADKLNEEEKFIGEILKYLQQSHTITTCDLHKGVKYLWDNNVIDSMSVRYRKSKSSSSEVMDEGYTVKQQYPDIFATLMSSPLNKTIFKYLRADNKLCRHFSVEPKLGNMSVAIYPDDANQIKETIDEILQNN